MSPRKLYEAFPAQMTPQQRAFIRELAAERGVAQNQALRDMIDHCRACPFFNANPPTNGNVSPMKESGQ